MEKQVPVGALNQNFIEKLLNLLQRAVTK